MVEEAPSTQVTFTVQRMGGDLGEVTVYWEAQQFAEDVVPSAGSINFTISQNENSFTVTILEDQVELFMSSVHIKLFVYNPCSFLS